MASNNTSVRPASAQERPILKFASQVWNQCMLSVLARLKKSEGPPERRCTDNVTPEKFVSVWQRDPAVAEPQSFERGDFKVVNSVCTPPAVSPGVYSLPPMIKIHTDVVDRTLPGPHSVTDESVIGLDAYIFSSSQAASLADHWTAGSLLLQQHVQNCVAAKSRRTVVAEDTPTGATRPRQLNSTLPYVPHVWRSARYILRSGHDGAFVLQQSSRRVHLVGPTNAAMQARFGKLLAEFHSESMLHTSSFTHAAENRSRFRSQRRKFEPSSRPRTAGHCQASAKLPQAAPFGSDLAVCFGPTDPHKYPPSRGTSWPKYFRQHRFEPLVRDCVKLYRDAELGRVMEALLARWGRFFSGVPTIRPCMLHGNLGLETAALAAPEYQHTFLSNAPDAAGSEVHHEKTASSCGPGISDPFVVVVKKNPQPSTIRELGGDQNGNSESVDVQHRPPSRVELTQAQFLGKLRPALNSADPVPVLQSLGVGPSQVPWYRSTSSGEAVTLAEPSSLDGDVGDPGMSVLAYARRMGLASVPALEMARDWSQTTNQNTGQFSLEQEAGDSLEQEAGDYSGYTLALIGALPWSGHNELDLVKLHPASAAVVSCLPTCNVIPTFLKWH
eukprot:INCI14779.4.p1 GENE.INCI14779.4~~INCI14779.4.p1  ORF type:complete len:613 (+),score=55.14 INCI14779.4:288-2126(+)